ncbi:hypothetical protein NE237_024337 [Protea cynaroides]|uniref:Leucine-rich repeat-containing N-terminal plant-type domain-containing protein n=1 Tax=Protea cynaroides TaxID=273540 RepID=A0A9Q0K702_9MAGN|nr:hypothetical protein NE237_024337 [Protea cynaroides]
MRKLNTYLNETDPNPCSWKGVTCSNNNRSITRLTFRCLKLSNSDFLTDSCAIDTLESLDVSQNSLTSIPDKFITDCGRINVLYILNFSANRLSDVLPTFSGFKGLQYLDLSYNSLSGNINSQLNGLVGLRSLNLSFNRFNGSVPTKLGKDMVLKELELAVNSFDGRIPEVLMN